jgi:hypothetical protein
MTFKQISKLILATLIVSVMVPFGLIRDPAFAHPPLDATPVGSEFKDPKYLNKGSCPDDPKNLIVNGGFFSDLHDTPYGPVVSPWQPFIYSGLAPQFRWVNNEGIFKSQSEQLFSTNAFDAGIMQTVQNLQPSVYYWFRLGNAPAAKSFSGENVQSPTVGTKVGVDPFGGTDSQSPNVIWGPDFFGVKSAANPVQLILLFPARSSNATLFLRAIARDGSGGENRVWFNAVCMEARPELGTAAPLPPTATPVPPTATATATRPPATRAPATKVALAPRSPTRPQEVIRAPDIPTPTIESSIGSGSDVTPRFARPNATPSPTLPIDPGQGALAGFGALMMVGGFFSFSIGLVLRKRIN